MRLFVYKIGYTEIKMIYYKKERVEKGVRISIEC
jgi:hypothetical protein